MKSKAFLAGGLALAASVAALAPATAHHSFAMYDHENQLKMVGTVADFKWQNPHVYIELDTTGQKNPHYTIECANPGILNRVGWKFNMIKPGDKITVIVAPLRNGEQGALLKQVELADGRKFSNGAPAGKPNIQ